MRCCVAMLCYATLLCFATMLCCETVGEQPPRHQDCADRMRSSAHRGPYSVSGYLISLIAQYVAYHNPKSLSLIIY